MTAPSIVHTGKDGAFSDATARAAVDDLFANVLPGTKKVVLYFHGGLDDKKTGQAIAANLDPVFRGAGAHPVFFVWESGLWEIISHNFLEIAGEDVFKILLKYVLKFAAGKIFGAEGGRAGNDDLALPNDLEVHTELAKRDAGHEPYADLDPSDVEQPLTQAQEDQFEQMLRDDTDFRTTVEAIIDSALPVTDEDSSRGITVRSRKSTKTLISPEVVDQAVKEGEVGRQAGGRGVLATAKMIKNGVMVLAAVIKRFRAKTAHGVYCTVVEEILREFYLANIGASVWGAMKKETLDTFQPATPARGGAYFLDKLGSLVKQSQLSISLVGHSTGAVFITHLLAEAEARRKAGTLPKDFAFANIIFLAPACTCAQLAPFVKEPFVGGATPLYRNFRSFGMQDAVESEDKVLSYAYPRSLLYLVSGVLERTPDGKSWADAPLVGMQRYQTDAAVYSDASVVAVREFFAADPARAVWSLCDDGAGRASASKKHGDFDDDPATLASLAHIVSTT